MGYIFLQLLKLGFAVNSKTYRWNSTFLLSCNFSFSHAKKFAQVSLGSGHTFKCSESKNADTAIHTFSKTRKHY